MDKAGNAADMIYERIRKLIDLQNQLKEYNSELLKKQEDLKQIIEKQKNEIEQLIDRNRNLKIAKSVKQSEENSDAKKRIDELMREIDRCIGLLNK